MVKINPDTTKRGFALLLTMIIVAIVLAIGLTILNITLKQYTLSVTGRESESSFHTAGAMLECILLWGLDDSYDAAFNSGSGPAIQCGHITASANSSTESVTGGLAYHHYYEFDDTVDGICGEISVYVMDASAGDITLDFLNDFGELEGLETDTCTQNNICRRAFARGFNRSCTELDSLRTVQREFSVRF